MLCFILFSFHNFRACITQCVCVCVWVSNVWCLFIEKQTQSYGSNICSTLLYSCPFPSAQFSFRWLCTALLLLLLQHLWKPVALLDFCWLQAYTRHTYKHTHASAFVHTCLFVLCTHTTYGHTNTPHFWMKFILQGRRMSTVEKLFKNSIRFQWIAIILMTRLKILNQAYICNRNRFCFLLHCIGENSVFFLNIKWNDAHNTNKHIFGAYYMFRKLSIFFWCRLVVCSIPTHLSHFR